MIFVTKNSEKHLKGIHFGYKNYFCQLCGEYFNEQNKLKYHIARVHEGFDSIIHQCHECGRKFLSKNYLNHHVEKVHKNNIPNVKCEQCGLSYTNKSSLSIHIKAVHKKERNFVSFVQKHFKIHKSWKTILKNIYKSKCDCCEKAFKKTSYLKEHISSVQEKVERVQ